MKLTLEQKLAKHFGVKTFEAATLSDKFKTKIDGDKREVEFIGNTYYYIDDDLDMLISGCCSKTIADKGPESKAIAKIKHQSDHRLDTQNVVGRILELDERKIDNYTVLYCKSFIADTRKGNDDIVNYREGIYDNHSIGFLYKNLIFAEKDSVDELSRKAWDEFYPLAINPDKADQYGYFWVVKEIELFEISVVSFGASSLTPNLTGKSKETNSRLKTEIIERVNKLSSQLKSSAETKEIKKSVDLEILQLKQIISDLQLYEPSKKSTEEPDNKDTDKSKSLFKKIQNNY